MSTEKLIQVVNETDLVIGAASRDEVYRDGRWHRAVGVVLTDADEHNILLGRYDDGNSRDIYDTSAAGYVGQGEQPHEAMMREIHGALGAAACQFVGHRLLDVVAYYRSRDQVNHGARNRYVRVYTAPLANLDALSISDGSRNVEWVETGQLRQIATDSPELLSPTLRRALKLWNFGRRDFRHGVFGIPDMSEE